MIGSTAYWLKHFQIGEQTSWWPFPKKFSLPKRDPGSLACSGVTWFYPNEEVGRQYQTSFVFKVLAMQPLNVARYRAKAAELANRLRERLQKDGIAVES
jgi:hypothetical protein